MPTRYHKADDEDEPDGEDGGEDSGQIMDYTIESIPKTDFTVYVGKRYLVHGAGPEQAVCERRIQDVTRDRLKFEDISLVETEDGLTEVRDTFWLDPSTVGRLIKNGTMEPYPFDKRPPSNRTS